MANELPGEALGLVETRGVYFDLLDTCEALLLAGLRERIGPEGDLNAAYREWYWKQMEEHDRMMFHMMEEFHRRTTAHAG